MCVCVLDKDPDKLLALSDELYTTLDDAQLLGKNCKRRSLILKTVFKLLDLYSPRLLLKLARLILAVSMLSPACLAVHLLLPRLVTGIAWRGL